MATDAKEFRETRMSRESRTTGNTGVLDQMRAVRESRKDPRQYYEEYGFSATPEQYEGMQASDKEFSGAVGDAQGMLDTASGDLDTAIKSAYDTLGTPESMANTAWEKDKSNWIPVAVYNKNKLEATYMLPRDIAGNLKAEVFTGEEGKYESHFFNNEGGVMDDDIGSATRLHVDVTPVGIGSAYGKELHEALSGTVSSYESAFMTNALDQATGVYQQGVKDIRGAYGTALGDLNEQQGILTGYETDRAAKYGAERTRYSDRLKTMQKLFGNISVG